MRTANDMHGLLVEWALQKLHFTDPSGIHQAPEQRRSFCKHLCLVKSYTYDCYYQRSHDCNPDIGIVSIMAKLYDLPLELRNRIYWYALPTDQTYIIDRNPAAPQICHTSKLLRRETVPIWIGSNIWQIRGVQHQATVANPPLIRDNLRYIQHIYWSRDWWPFPEHLSFISQCGIIVRVNRTECSIRTPKPLFMYRRPMMPNHHDPWIRGESETEALAMFRTLEKMLERKMEGITTEYL